MDRLLRESFHVMAGTRMSEYFPLGDFDVAINQEIDTPPYGTKIFAKNLDNRKTVIVKKKDNVCLHPGVVLDLRTKTFKMLGGGDRCDGWITNATYIPIRNGRK